MKYKINIETIKNVQNGYLVNGNMFVPKDETNIDYLAVKQKLEEGYVPESEFTEKEIEDKRILLVKNRAGEIISSKYSITWQLNHPRSDEAYKLDYQWIDKIRDISNKAEINKIALDDIDWGI